MVRRKEAQLCRYSRTLQARDFCTRKAQVGDDLFLINIGRICGFAHQDEKTEKVRLTCLRPGTEIVFERRFLIEGSRSFVECDNGERIMVTDIIPTREATFAGLPGGGRPTAVDAVKWPNGLGMGLNCMPLGIHIRVLQLPAVKQRKKVKAPKVEQIERRAQRRSHVNA
jgi:hypothetical protein